MPIIRTNEKGEFELVEVDLDSWKTTFRRLLINGPPLSGKTTSLKTFPAIQRIIAAPGELGHSSIREDEYTKLYYWEVDPAASNVQYARVWAQVQRLTNEILAGKHGELTTFAIDGLHKLIFVIMCANGWTPDTEGKVYPKYYKLFNEYLGPILASTIPYVVCTTYDGREALEPGSKISQVFPELPGKLAKDVMGTFPVAFHSVRQGDGENQKFLWELRARGNMQAAGMHLPPELTKLFPATMPQDWNEIEKILSETK